MRSRLCQWPGTRRSVSTGGRAHQHGRQRWSDGASSTAIYASALAVATLGLSYASVPLYRMFCQATGYGGTVQTRVEDKLEALANSNRNLSRSRTINVEFNADTSTTMAWRFAPAQKSLKVKIGETALAFYRVKNTANKPVIGVAAYNVTPMKAAVYFNKIQCFCFEEQRLRAHEEIELPVFFFLDPAMLDDPKMDDVSSITLSYTFFPVDDDEEDQIAARLMSVSDNTDSASEAVLGK